MIQLQAFLYILGCVLGPASKLPYHEPFIAQLFDGEMSVQIPVFGMIGRDQDDLVFKKNL